MKMLVPLCTYFCRKWQAHLFRPKSKNSVVGICRWTQFLPFLVQTWFCQVLPKLEKKRSEPESSLSKGLPTYNTQELGNEILNEAPVFCIQFVYTKGVPKTAFNCCSDTVFSVWNGMRTTKGTFCLKTDNRPVDALIQHFWCQYLADRSCCDCAESRSSISGRVCLWSSRSPFLRTPRLLASPYIPWRWHFLRAEHNFAY